MGGWTLSSKRAWSAPNRRDTRVGEQRRVGLVADAFGERCRDQVVWVVVRVLDSSRLVAPGTHPAVSGHACPAALASGLAPPTPFLSVCAAPTVVAPARPHLATCSSVSWLFAAAQLPALPEPGAGLVAGNTNGTGGHHGDCGRPHRERVWRGRKSTGSE